MTRHMDQIVTDLEGLSGAIKDAIAISGRQPSEIYIDTGMRFRLIEEILSDGSSVFNVSVGG